jgi:hypothetical protein
MDFDIIYAITPESHFNVGRNNANFLSICLKFLANASPFPPLVTYRHPERHRGAVAASPEMQENRDAASRSLCALPVFLGYVNSSQRRLIVLSPLHAQNLDSLCSTVTSAAKK